MPYSVRLSSWEEEKEYLNKAISDGLIAGYNYTRDEKAVHVTVFFF